MNYLTMRNAGKEMAVREMTDCNLEEPQPGSLYRDSNIYSVPLFYNDFYETADQTVKDSHEATQSNEHHICNETEETVVPEACGRSCYTSETWKRQYVNSDVAKDVSLRDSGTASLPRTSDVTQAMHSTSIEVSPVYVNEIPEKGKVANKKCSKYFYALLVGFVGGITLCSVVWLTIDKLKSDNLNCIVQTFHSSRDETVNVTAEIPESERFPVNDLQQTASSNNQLTTKRTRNSDGPFLSTSRTVMTTTPMSFTSDTQSSISDTTATSTPTYQGTSVTKHNTKFTSSSKEVSVSALTTESNVLSSTQGTDGETIVTEDNPAQNNATIKRDTTTIKLSKTMLSSTLSTLSDVNTVLQEGSTASRTESFTDVTSDKDEPIFAGLSLTTESLDSAEGGYVYVRWGRQDCPSDNDLLYSGFIAGGHFIHSGGATNNLCLPSHPTWSNYDDRLEPDRNLLHVTEYQSWNAAFNTIIGKPLQDQNVPCAVCQARGRFSYVMIPGRAKCLYGWQEEYTGYLMGGSFEHLHGKSLVCVDKDPQTVPGSSANEDGNLLYFVEFRGTGTENYVNGRELACAVCTK